MESKRLTVFGIVVGIVMGISGWVAVFLMFWFRWYPDPTMEPEIMRPLMAGWLPVVVITTSSLLSAVMLLIVAVRVGSNKRLKEQVAGLDSKATKMATVTNKALKEAKEAALRENDLRGQRDGLSKLYDESRKELADLGWLRQLAEEEGTNISEHVVITAVKPGSLKLAVSPRCVTIGLFIRNESIFDITIRAENVKGHLFFKTRRLDEPARVLLDSDRPPIENLKPMQKEILVIEQPLRGYEAETISEADEEARFWLGNLSIPISVENVPLQVETKDLRIGVEVEHLYLKTFGKKTSAPSENAPHHVLTRQQLLEEIEALPPADRASATKAALEIYGESLYDKDTNAPK